MILLLTFIQKRLVKAASLDFDNLDGIKTAGAFEPQDGVDGELREEIFVLTKNLGGEGCAGNVHKILPE